jgi:hypothetical protein
MHDHGIAKMQGAEDPDAAIGTAPERISDALMAQWRETNPNNNGVQAEVEAHQIVTPADNSKLIGTGQSPTYGTVTPQDVQVWKNETYKMAVYNSGVP